MQVGQIASARRTFSQADFNRFAALSGDDNPIHVEPAFAARTTFGRTVAHGMFLYSNMCSMLGSQLPGPGTLQLMQELTFPNPTYVDEQVTLQLEVVDIQPSEHSATLSTVITKPDGNTSLQGQTLVRLPGAAGFGGLGSVQASSLTGEQAAAHKGLQVGQRVQMRRLFTAQDLAEYADLVRDSNPIFTSAGYAQRLGLAGPIVPGGLLGGLFSCLLGTRLPGRGTGWLKQKLGFPAPAYPGEEITAVVEIIRVRPEKDLVNLRTVCTNPQGVVVCAGEALVLVKNLEVTDAQDQG